MELKTQAQKDAFDKLFNAKHYNYYGVNDGWCNSRQIGVNRNVLKALVKQGLVEYKQVVAWAEVNAHWYRLK
jgi:hypothetical protein